MSLMDKLFSGGKEIPKSARETKGEHNPSLDLPIDEKFIIEFKKSGGKFVYCENLKEVNISLAHILMENQWQHQQLLCVDPSLKVQFESLLFFTELAQDSEILFTQCENLIAENGTILVCSHQLFQLQPSRFPENFIVFARTSQILKSLNEALKYIRQKYQTLPANITSLKNNTVTKENQQDFMNYGTKTKNLYLLLLEDF